MEPWPSRRERIGNGHPPKARLRTGVAVGRLSRPYRSPLAARALKEAGQARRVGKGAAAEHRTQNVVRARAEPLPRVSQALHQRVAPQPSAADRAQATSEAISSVDTTARATGVAPPRELSTSRSHTGEERVESDSTSPASVRNAQEGWHPRCGATQVGVTPG